MAEQEIGTHESEPGFTTTAGSSRTSSATHHDSRVTSTRTTPSPGASPSSTKPRRKKKKKNLPVIDLTQDADVTEHTMSSAGPSTPAIEQASDSQKSHKKKRKTRDDSTKDANLLEDSAEPSAPHRKRRARSTSPRERRRSPSVQLNDNTIFCIDVTPVPVAPPNLSTSKNQTITANSTSDTTSSLLLPEHVSVLPSTNGSHLPVEIIPAVELDSEDEGFIEFIDYDDRPAAGMVRYWEQPEEDAPQASRTVCKHCGAKGEHKTFECTVMICLTCGARDEHSTRSCPISKTCFQCGLKGHILQNCPNRHMRPGRGQDCDRCGLSGHKSMECPTIWRIYEYFTHEEREDRLRLNALNEGKAFDGEGGEAYIATDQWCHTCGESGHLGDDCPDRNYPLEVHSAFGSYNLMAGPFYDPDEQLEGTTQRGLRDWEATDHLADGWGFNAPNHVGKQGRKKEKARMAARAQQARDDDDDDGSNWFERQQSRPNDSRRDRDRKRSEPMPPPSKKKPQFSFNSGHRNDSRDHRWDDREMHSTNRDNHRPSSGNCPSGGGFSIKGAASRNKDPSDPEPSSRRERRAENQRRRDESRDRSQHGRYDSGHRDRGRDHDYGYRDRDSSDSRRNQDSQQSFKPRYRGGYPR